MDEFEAVDRNWYELLQELRVTQTGLQILTGFLVTLPFQARFEDLVDRQRLIYLVTLSTAVVATAVVLAPASYHRLLFRQREKPGLAMAGHECARLSLGLGGLAVTGVVWLLFDVVVSPPTGMVAAAACLSVFVGMWWGVPLVFRRTSTLTRTPPRSPREPGPG